VGFVHDRHDSDELNPKADRHPLRSGARTARPSGYTPGQPVPGEVVVYFADDPRKLYQLKPWLPVFERLDEQRPVLVVNRHPQTYAEVQRLSTLRCVLTPTFSDLAELVESSDHKVAIYVNNSANNFQLLVARRMLHIHVNHGESDKICMVSNQVKAYDRVFVAGEAAVRRYRAALMEFDESRLVPVGRPQLDLRPEPVLPVTSRRTILYAPTWEGESPSNNYTSVDVYGPAIAASALAVPHVRVIYKPHPRVAISRHPDMTAAHTQIVRLLESAALRDPTAGHRVDTDSDILAVFPRCDLMITDVSSVGLDFVYVRMDQPLFVTDRRGDRDKLHADAPVTRVADVVDATTIGTLTHTLTARLAADPLRAAREAARQYYFGDVRPGESTERFLAAVDEVVRTRDRMLRAGDSGDVSSLTVDGRHG